MYKYIYIHTPLTQSGTQVGDAVLPLYVMGLVHNGIEPAGNNFLRGRSRPWAPDRKRPGLNGLGRMRTLTRGGGVQEQRP